MTRTLLTVLLTMLFLASPVSAGSLRFTVAGGVTPALQVSLLDFQLTNGRGSVGVHWSGTPGLAVHLRNTTTFGPLGNVVADLDAAVNANGEFTAALAGRGALGPLAIRLRLHAGNADGLPQLRPADASFARLPAARGSLLWGVQAGATWRLSRELLLTFEPAYLAGSRGGELLLPFELQLPRFVGSHDLRLRVSTMVSLTRSADAWSAAGAGLRIDRGRQAAWEVWLSAGGNARLFSPGLSFAVQEQLAGGQLRAGFRLEPWRSDLSVLDLEASWTRAFGSSQLETFLYMGMPATRLTAGLAWAVPVD